MRLKSSVNASAVYEHVARSSTARRMSLYRSMTLFVLSCQDISNVHQQPKPERKPVTPTLRSQILGQTEYAACRARRTRRNAQHHIGSRNVPSQCSCLCRIINSAIAIICLVVPRLTFHDHPLRLVSIFSYEPFDALVMLHEVECLSIRPYSLHQADCVGIHPLRVLGHIRDRMWYLETQPKQVANFLEQRDNLWVEVDCELETAPAQADNLEKSPCNAHVAAIDVVEPCFEYWPRIELAAECGGFRLELLTFSIQLPAFAEYVLNTL